MRIAIWIGGLAVGFSTVVSTLLLAQSPGGSTVAAGKSVLLPPPKFSKSVDELFFDDARTHLGPGKPGGGRPMQPAGGAPAGGGDAGDAFPGGSFAWSKIISGENLEAEVKSAAPAVAETVKSINIFKGKGREVAQTSYTVLAMLFGVINRFDGDVKWKKDSAGLTKAYSQVAANCKTSSDAAYKEAKKRSEDLGELLRGGSVDLPKADGVGEWHDILNRPALMRRLEEGREGGKITKGIGNKADFKKNKDALMREAQMLAVISEVIKDKAFESADDENYQKYAASLQKNCLELIEAIKSDNQDKAQATFAQVSKSCDTCHGDFR